MNKLDFLRRLDRELSALDQTERRELLAFYEERFYTGTIYENKTEEQVVAELESPEVIARNVLSEYGISVKEAKNYSSNYKDDYELKNKRNRNEANREVKTEENRQNRSINTSSLVWLIVIDVLVLSWAIPTLFSVLVSMATSLLTYVGVLGFLASGNIYDQMIFWFVTGAYIILFLFTLGVLELFIGTCKKTTLWHMRVFRFKKVNEWNKKLSKISVEGWFKRHKLLRFIKNTSGVAAIVVMTYTGFYLWGHYDDIKELYIDQAVLTDVQRIDVSDEVTSAEVWSLLAEIDSMDVQVIPTVGSDIVVTRTYLEDSQATYSVDFDLVTNQINIIHDLPIQVFNFGLSIEDIFTWFQNESIVVEIPQDLLMDLIDLTVTNGTVEVNNFTLTDLIVDGGNGTITIRNMVASNDINIESSNAAMYVSDSIGANELYVKTSNGKIVIRDSAFSTYELRTSNGKILLENLNVELLDGVDLKAVSSNGALDFSNVYVAHVDARTSNGNINYVNANTSFDVDFERNTSNGQITTNVN